MFYVTEFTDVCNFADDSTFLACDNDLKHPMERLEHATKLAIEWLFENNYIKLNEDKCYLLVAEHSCKTLWTNIRETRIWDSKNEKLLGLTIDRNLNFVGHMFALCKTADRKLSVLSRISKNMSFEKNIFLVKAFVESQFAYCALTLMFHNRPILK